MLREALAALLGIAVGLFFVFAPAAVLRTQTTGRRPQNRGEYGSDGEFPRQWELLVRAIGVLSIAIAAGLVPNSVDSELRCPTGNRDEDQQTNTDEQDSEIDIQDGIGQPADYRVHRG